MGCFSFISRVSGKPALSDSDDGSPCWVFRVYNGQIIEYMHGNYDSYGRVFADTDRSKRFNWKYDIGGYIMLLEDEWKEGDPFPTEFSEYDPDQGWGGNWEFLTGEGKFPTVEEPKHVVFDEAGLNALISYYSEAIDYYKGSKHEHTEAISKYKEKIKECKKELSSLAS